VERRRQRRAPLLGHEQPVVALAASRDGRTLASAGARGEVLLWDLRERRVRLVLAGAGPTVWALAFLPDGSRVLGAAADGAVRVWGTDTGALLGRPLRPAGSPPAGRGPALFAACAACHALTAGDGGGRAGPTLFGLFGRRAGAVPGYPYSRALRESDVVWSDATVSRLFEVGPDRFLPGTKMPLQRLPSARDRADLIAYLKRVGGGG
jgi:cytochrome c